MVGHGAVLNEASVGDHSLVGMNATVNAGVAIGRGSIVASGTTIPEDREIPPESFVRGVPARITPLAEVDIDADEIFETYSSGEYTNLARRHGMLFD